MFLFIWSHHNLLNAFTKFLVNTNALVVVILVVFTVLVENRTYNNGLIFYDLQTKNLFLPPTVSVSRGRSLAVMKYSSKGSIWSTFGKRCECSGAICGCCAGIKVKQYNFNQKMCANVTFLPEQRHAILDIFLDEKPSARYGLSARNPSPFCIPVMLGVPMAMCVQMSNIAIRGNNLNMCMDFSVRLASTDLFEMHFQCMRMGLDGLQYLDKEGITVLPPSQQRRQTVDAIEKGKSEETVEEEDEGEDVKEDEEGKDESGGENEEREVEEIYINSHANKVKSKDEKEEEVIVKDSDKNFSEVKHKPQKIVKD